MKTPDRQEIVMELSAKYRDTLPSFAASKGGRLIWLQRSPDLLLHGFV